MVLVIKSLLSLTDRISAAGCRLQFVLLELDRFGGLKVHQQHRRRPCVCCVTELVVAVVVVVVVGDLVVVGSGTVGSLVCPGHGRPARVRRGEEECGLHWAVTHSYTTGWSSLARAQARPGLPSTADNKYLMRTSYITPHCSVFTTLHCTAMILCCNPSLQIKNSNKFKIVYFFHLEQL